MTRQRQTTSLIGGFKLLADKKRLNFVEMSLFIVWRELECPDETVGSLIRSTIDECDRS